MFAEQRKFSVHGISATILRSSLPSFQFISIMAESIFGLPGSITKTWTVKRISQHDTRQRVLATPLRIGPWISAVPARYRTARVAHKRKML